MITVMKLITGEELVGDVTQGDKVTIQHPCMLQMVPTRANPEQVSMALVPVAMHIENHSFTLNPEHVLWMHKPVNELYNQYNAYFGSGIQLAGV